MQDIFTLFRGQDEFGRWHYGAAWLATGHPHACIVDSRQVFHAVYRHTVSPYVNRKDKNGKLVFLGDVVRIKGSYADTGEEYDDIFQVMYSEDNSGFCLPDGDFLPDKEQFATECEVVGNVFDRPELSEACHEK